MIGRSWIQRACWRCWTSPISSSEPIAGRCMRRVIRIFQPSVCGSETARRRLGVCRAPGKGTWWPARDVGDCHGAGYSTYVLGAFLSRYGGQLISVDHDPEHCAFARHWTDCFDGAVSVVEADSVEWLRRNPQSIDVLLLDSRDTDLEGAAEH